MKHRKKIAIIGAGFSGMVVAGLLSKKGFKVKVFDKNAMPGGRCHVWKKDGFTFDMGPSWYWMPDVFERYFSKMDRKVSDYYDLKRLEPSYKIFFEDEEWNIPSNYNDLCSLLEKHEKGSTQKLNAFLLQAQKKYEIGMNDLVYNPSLSWKEYINYRTIKGTLQYNLFGSFSKHVKKYFSHPKIIQLLEFPVLFLGAKPEKTPSLYSLMNYADIKLGTWYPMGGMYKIAEAFESVAKEYGAEFYYNSTINKINVENKNASQIVINNEVQEFDYVISSADYHHTETQLLPKKYRNYTQKFWDKQQLSPSCLLYYIGVSKKIPNLEHHNLFFDADFNLHAKEIYDTPQFPANPLFYVCCPSKTDDSVAPANMENIFILIPIAPDLKDTEEIQEKYKKIVLERIESHTKTSIQEHIITERSFAVSDFKEVYNSFKGNAYGLANTLQQTAVFRPSIRNKKVENLFYCGQLSVPGPGVPPSIVSGSIVAEYISKL